MEVAVIISLSTAFLIELIVILFKFKLFDPYREKKERQANPDVVSLKEQFDILRAARIRKMDEAKSIEVIVDRITTISTYMPSSEFNAIRESLEVMKEKHYSIIKECEEYDILIKNNRNELNRIREERKLKYL